MPINEVVEKLRTDLTTDDLTTLKLSLTEIIPQLQEEQTAHDEAVATKDKTINELNETITERDNRIKELEDSNRVLLERYGAVVMQEKKDDAGQDDNEPDEVGFDEFITKFN